MGIRFYCPQGHKLNVKSFLAGKRGICPHCGAKVDIPLTSTRGSSKDEARHDDVVPMSAPQAAVGALVAQPVANPQTNVPVATPVGAPAGQASAAPPSAAAGTTPSPAPQGPLANGQVAPDPIAESPQSIWYVRPNSGGQFGPATGAIMRQWLTEGRVAADSLVWREGWPEWQSAGNVFAKFSNSSTHSTETAPSAGPTTAGIIPGGGQPGQVQMAGNLGPASNPPANQAHAPTYYPRGRRQSNSLVVIVVVLLILMVLALLPILFYVLLRGPAAL